MDISHDILNNFCTFDEQGKALFKVFFCKDSVPLWWSHFKFFAMCCGRGKTRLGQETWEALITCRKNNGKRAKSIATPAMSYWARALSIICIYEVSFQSYEFSASQWQNPSLATSTQAPYLRTPSFRRGKTLRARVKLNLSFMTSFFYQTFSATRSEFSVLG